jgi:large subunit ribosomal protein L10
MSKYVKNLVSQHVRQRLEGVRDALLVNMVGLDANASHRLRGELRQKQIDVMVVKNSLAARAVEGTPLAPMFHGLAGTSAVCWGSQDIVSLAKEVVRLSRLEKYAAFQPRGGAMDGERLSAEDVVQVARWPSREEQIALLVRQILGPGAQLAAQILGPGGALAGQVSRKAEGVEEGPPPESPAA